MDDERLCTMGFVALMAKREKNGCLHRRIIVKFVQEERDCCHMPNVQKIQTDLYHRWLEGIKRKIRSAQLKAATTVNAQLVELYWDLAKDIVNKQREANWGDNVLEQLSIDLKLNFPDSRGFSRRNRYAVRQWYLFYADVSEFVPQPVAQIPWGHNRLIVSKTKDVEEALF